MMKNSGKSSLSRSLTYAPSSAETTLSGGRDPSTCDPGCWFPLHSERGEARCSLGSPHTHTRTHGMTPDTTEVITWARRSSLFLIYFSSLLPLFFIFSIISDLLSAQHGKIHLHFQGVRIPAATTDPGTPHKVHTLSRRPRCTLPFHLQVRFHALSLAVFVG